MTISAPAVALGLAAILSAGATSVLAPEIRPRPLVAAAGLVALASLALAPNLSVVAAVALALGALLFRVTKNAAVLRPAGLAAGLFAVATVAASGPPGGRSDRIAALAAALGIAAFAGLAPFVAELDESSEGRSAFTVTAWVAPGLAFAAAARVQALVAPGSWKVFGGSLIALGCANVVWGLLAAFADEERAPRHAYLADWGLALVGLGLLSATGWGAALLLLLMVLLLRVPLLSGRGGARLLTAAALGGFAPFAGFAARVLLLRGLTSSAWPLALAVGLALVLWLPISWRIAANLMPLRGRALATLLALLALTAALGLYPLGVLRPVGLG